MKRLLLIYEQLEEAKAYLVSRSRFDLRLALILADNVAELMMFNVLRETFSRDDWLRPLRKNAEQLGVTLDSALEVKYTTEERKRAEQEFEPMVRLLHRLSKLSSSDATILRISHRLRRDAFHRGQLREDILEPLVCLLFNTVAVLTESLAFTNLGYVAPLDDEDQAFVRRYELTTSIPMFNSDEARKNCPAKLVEGVEFDLDSFRNALINDHVGRVQESLKGLDGFYQTDDEKDLELLKYQFWKEMATQGWQPKRDEFDAVFATWQHNAIPIVTTKWLRQFETSVSRRLNSRHASQVLATYWGLDEDFVPKERFIDDHISAVDEAIQHQIDLARGK